MTEPDDRGARRPARAGPGAVAAGGRASAVAGFLLGLGVVAFVDEAVFHQILGWHHFYDKAGSAVGLVSDGLFHAFSWFATVGSLVAISRLRRDRMLRPRALTGGLLTGAGLFQFYDGLVQHKLLGLHQIRYGVPLLVYDVVWNVIAAALLVAGVALLATAPRRA